MQQFYMMGWPEVFERLNDFKHHKGTRIFGVPRGGAIVAGLLGQIGHQLVAKPSDADIYVDDIIDSGRTMAEITAKHGSRIQFALVDRRKPADANLGWVRFPWEESPDLDIQNQITRILQYLCENPKRPGLVDTPARVVKSWKELYGGYIMDPKEILARTFPKDGYDQMIAMCNIDFVSMCEHHMLPFIGKAHVAYIPGTGDKVVGASKLSRLVECFARRLQIQERLTKQISDALTEHTGAKGVGVVIEAKHFCMVCRGVRQQNATMITSSLTGAFRLQEVRQEFLILTRCGNGLTS